MDSYVVYAVVSKEANTGTDAFRKHLNEDKKKREHVNGTAGTVL